MNEKNNRIYGRMISDLISRKIDNNTKRCDKQKSMLKPFYNIVLIDSFDKKYDLYFELKTSGLNSVFLINLK